LEINAARKILAPLFFSYLVLVDLIVGAVVDRQKKVQHVQKIK